MSIKAVSEGTETFMEPGKKKNIWLFELCSCFLFLIIIFLAVSFLQVKGLTDLSGEIRTVKTDENTAIVTIPLSGKKDLGNTDLKFSARGCIVEVRSGDELLYEYGSKDAAEGHFIGRIHVSIPLTEDDTEITLKLTAHDVGAELSPDRVRLCPRAETYRYYLINGSSGFFSGIIFIAMAFCLPLVSLMIEIKPAIRKAGLYASGFFLCFAVLLLDVGGHYLIFAQNQAAWNVVHEFAAYLLPFFVLLFFREMEIAKIQRAVLLAGAVKDILFVLAAAILGFSCVIPFDRIAAIYRYSLIVDGAIGIYGVYWNIKNPRIPAGQKTILFVTVGWVAALCVSFVASRISPVFAYTPDFDFFGLVAILVFYVFIFMFMELIFAAESEFWQMGRELELTRTKNFNSQMQPHFLYNALSSIRQIIYEDPDYAAKLISDFTRHLRGTIRAMSNDQPIPFSEELRNIKAYVSIEKVRFGEKFNIDYDIQADNFEIIPLTVQPLIENAIRHGIYRRGEMGGVVTLRSAEMADRWTVQVMDNGIGFDVEKVLGEVDAGKRDSAGLKSLIFRLEKLMDAKVQIESVINRGTTITVSIPKRVEGKR